MHDGPGIRTTVFLKGCPLRCKWCHNPETQKIERQLLYYSGKCIACGACSVCREGAHSFEKEHTVNRLVCKSCGLCASWCPTGALQLCGKEYTPEEVLNILEKDRAFYGERGGVTLSGGEPFLQAKEAVALLRFCKERKLRTAVETCGYFAPDVLHGAIPVTDLFLWDLKDTDPVRHREFTGVSTERILSNLFLADKLGAAIRLRCILINGINANEEHYRRVAEIAGKLSHCEGVEWIPYHAFAGSKATFLGLSDNGVKEWIPSQSQMDLAKQYLVSHNVPIFD